MHIPDAMLSPPVWASAAVVGVGAVAVASRVASRRLDERQVPLLGVSGAFVFAVQMLNFWIPPSPTSGHFLGGVLVGALVGPASAVLVLASVLLLQCLVFQDGGFTALGANLLNMGLVGGLLGALARRLAGAPSGKTFGRRLTLLAFAAGWLATVLGALLCAAEIAVSNATLLADKNQTVVGLFALMGGIHAAIGVGEGIITASALGLLVRVRPDLLELEPV